MSEPLGQVRELLQRAIGTSERAVATADQLSREINGDAGLRALLADHTATLRKQGRRGVVNQILIVCLIVMFLVVGAGIWYTKNLVDCVNGLNDGRARTAVAFQVAELYKVDGQIRGMDRLLNRDAVGFVIFKRATEQYRATAEKRAKELGIKVVTDADGNIVRLTPPSDSNAAHC